MANFQLDQTDPELAEYRPISPLAVVALLLGFASALALIDPLLWIVPVVGVTAAAAAIAGLKRSGVLMLGRKAAVIGLVLSLLFGSAAPARHFTRHWWLEARASRFADHWFHLLQAGQPYHAHQLMMPDHRRVPLPDNPREVYRQEELESFDQDFIEKAPVPLLLQKGETVEYTLQGARIERYSGDLITLDYVLRDTTNPAANPTQLQLILERVRYDGSDEQWRISSFRLP